MAYYDLSAVPTTQLGALTAASGVPPQEVTAEMLKRSQMQNASGYAGLPVLASANPPPLVPATPGATYAQEDFGYPVGQGLSWGDVGNNVLRALGNVVGGPVGATAAPMVARYANSRVPDVVRAAAESMHSDQSPVNVVPADALAQELPAQDPSVTGGADIAALLRSIPSGPNINIKPVELDWQKYRDQVKNELPDTLSGVADALTEQKTKLNKQEKNALSQGLLSAGLSMLASRGSFFNALGNAGKEGLAQYNQQKQSAQAGQAALLSDQLRAAQTEQANNAAAAQIATSRASEDARTQQMNDQLRIHAAIAQQNPQMLRAQIGLMRLGMAKSPYQDMADKDFKETMDLYAKGVIPGMPGAQDQFQAIQLYATQRRNAILRGIDPSQIPFPSSKAPAGVRAR